MAQVFVGRLSRDVRTRDLERIFSRYGPLVRCDIKSGSSINYAFIDYEDERDAEDAIRYEDGRDLHGRRMAVEWAKGPHFRYRQRSRYSSRFSRSPSPTNSRSSYNWSPSPKRGRRYRSPSYSNSRSSSYYSSRSP